jgi:hypothetical protein
MSDLEQMREDVIRKIQATFPKNPPTKNANKWKLAKHARQLEGRSIEEKLRGKRWDEIVDADGLQYWFTEPDFLISITSKAFLYYLPAFLIASVDGQYTHFLHRSFFSKVLSESADQMSIEQIEAIVAYFEFHALYYREREARREKDQIVVRALEDMALQWMFKLENKKDR